MGRRNRKKSGVMTRFKELRRIERAIENRDQVELDGAAKYCQLRLSYVRTKQGEAT
jgi:hypothetical protein